MTLRLTILTTTAFTLLYWLTTDAVWPHVVAALAYVWGHAG